MRVPDMKKCIHLMTASILLVIPSCTNTSLQSANNLLESGDFLAARRIYAKIAQKRPQSFEAHFGLGMTYSAEAMHKTDLSLATPGDWYPAIYHLSRAANLGTNEKVQQTLAILHFNLGAAYKKRGDADAAIERLEQAVSYDSTLLKAFNLLGTLHQQKGNLARALMFYRQTIKLQPAYAKAHFNIGSIAWAQQDFELARVHFEKALQLEPDNAYFRLWYEKAATRAG
ncbi:MAG: tetratricopeptide repeat protein [Chitinivibrionales bacterium]|nr:tetratricopeptide repeat protein [Chitinivibrionales bacterium]